MPLMQRINRGMEDSSDVALDPRVLFRVNSSPDTPQDTADPIVYTASGIPAEHAAPPAFPVRGHTPPAYIAPPAPPIVIQSNPVPTLVPVIVTAPFSFADVPLWAWAGAAAGAWFLFGGKHGR